MPDPVLKQAMAEIRAVMTKHDIGGAVTLVSATHSEFYYHLTPSWSICYFAAPTQLQFRSKLADFKTEEEQQRCTELTVHMVHQLRDLGAQNFTQMSQVIDMLNEHFEIEHTPYADFEPHDEH